MKLAFSEFSKALLKLRRKSDFVQDPASWLSHQTRTRRGRCSQHWVIFWGRRKGNSLRESQKETRRERGCRPLETGVASLEVVCGNPRILISYSGRRETGT